MCLVRLVLRFLGDRGVVHVSTPRRAVGMRRLCLREVLGWWPARGRGRRAVILARAVGRARLGGQ